MKKFASLWLSLLLALGLLAACGNAETEKKDNPPAQSENAGQKEKAEEPEKAGFPVTLKDASDQDVTIEKKPEKIISLMPSNTEILYALGEGDAIAGVSESDNYPEEVADKEKVASMDLNVEKILSLQPDLVLAHGSTASMWESGFQQLRDSGLTVLVIEDAQNFDAIYGTIEKIGKATGRADKAAELVSKMKADIDKIEEKAATIKEEDQRTVFTEISPAPEIYAAGKNTFMDEMLKVIHAKNAVEQDGYVPMNEEAIIESDPDVIIVNYSYVENAVEGLLGRPGWQDMKAVKDKRVFQVQEDITSRPGPRITEGVEELAKAVYPDVFGD